MSGQPRLSFDTSAVNALADSKDWGALLAGIRSGYFSRITFTSIAETVATSDAGRRNRLFDILNTLHLNGEYLEAHQWILTQLVQNYEKYGSSRWDSLNLRFEECEISIARRELSDAESKEEREFAPTVEKQFFAPFTDTRPKFEQVFADGTARPTSADELFAHLKGEGGAFWIMAAGLYERAAGRRPTEEQVRAFVEECPPFRALMLGLVHAQFEWAIREKQAKKDKRVGRIDLFCAIYLPYCDLFITNDDEQRRCLREIAAAANLPVEILSFSDFRDRLMPPHLSIGARVAIAGLAIAVGVGFHRDVLPVHAELPIPAEPSQLTASVTFTPTANVAAFVVSNIFNPERTK